MGTDMCAQDCTDTVGSYTCSCRSGYMLNSDRRTCMSMLAIIVCMAVM